MAYESEVICNYEFHLVKWRKPSQNGFYVAFNWRQLKQLKTHFCMIFRGQSGEILHYLTKSRPIDIRSHFVRCLSFMKMCSLFKCWYAAATANQSANGKYRFGIKLPILMLLPHVHFICRKLWLGLAQSQLLRS